MRFTGIDIERYGPHRDLSVDSDTLSSGMSVFLGPNSRGKSALRAFMRMILFNRVDRRQRIEAETFNYSHDDGGVGAGTIRFETSEGQSYTVHRIEGNSADVTGGAIGGDDLLRDLIGRIDPALYQNVFSISLTELHSMESLGKAQVSERIYSAGLGLSVSLPAAIKQLEDERSTASGLWGPRKGRLRDGLRRLNDLRSELEASTAEMARYESIGTEIEAFASEIARFDTKILEARQREASLDELVTLRADQQRIRTEIEDGNATAAGRKTELDALPVSKTLTERGDAARRLTSEQEHYAKAVSDRPALVHQLEEAQAGIRQRTARIGSDWNEQKLRNFEDAQSATEEIEDSWSEVASAQRILDSAETKLEVSDEALQNASKTLDELNSRLNGLTVTPSETTEELELKRDRLERLRSAVSERDNLQLKIASVSGNRPPGQAWTSGTSFAAALALIGVVETALAIAVGQIVAVVAGIALIAGAGLLWFDRRQNPSAENDADHGLQEAFDLAQSEVSSLTSELGYDDRLADSALVEAQNRLNRQIDRRREFDRLSADVAAAKRNCDELSAQHELAAAVRMESASKNDKALRRWGDTLQRFNLPKSDDNAAAISVIGQIETLRSDLREVDSLRTRIAAIDRTVDDIESRLRPLLDEVGMPTFEPRGATAALADLQRAIDDNTTASVQAIEIEKQLAEWNSRLATLEATTQKLQTELDTKARALEFHIHQPEGGVDLDLPSMPARQPDLLAAARPATAIVPNVSIDAAIDAEKLSIADRIAELSAERDEARDRRTELVQQQHQLEDANPITQLQTEIDELEQRVEADAHRWAVLTLAMKAINDTKVKYQSERQAPLHQLASKHLREITQGQCERVEAVVGEEELRVVESSGRIKSVTELSRGTREQLYLSLRFALIDEYAQHAEPLPVIMDDVMVNFDAERTRLACRTALEFSNTHQVFYLTCDERIAEMMTQEAESADCPKPALVEL